MYDKRKDNWANQKWRKGNRGIAEFKDFIQYTLLPILGIKNQNIIVQKSSQNERIQQTRNYETGEYEISFSASNYSLRINSVPYILPSDTIIVGTHIIDAFLDISCFYVDTGSVHNHYPNETIYKKVLDAAVQNGICNWSAGRSCTSFYELIRTLETWAVKTYEGKKVSFGFVYDPDIESDFSTNGNGTWMSFLQSDYSATLSDGIHSVIELDKRCVFSRFLSLSNGGKEEGYSLNNNTPYRFSHVIQEYVFGSRVGIFLLNNGDIVLAKNQAVQFIKRNLRWLNISYDAFVGVSLAKLGFSSSESKLRSLFEAVYASVLDVSFSHAGGIISVVEKPDLLMGCWEQQSIDYDQTNAKKGKYSTQPVINPCDDLMSQLDDDDIKKRMKVLQPDLDKDEVSRRLLKRKVVCALIREQNFIVLDRKLRAELIAMDGACVMDFNGNIHSIGAIIQNDSGSSGGGRTSAAKKLSKYGLAVKVSTDGYIELFIKEKNIYSIK